MTDGNTLIVDVVQKGDYYVLNDTPVNMMIAYEVVRRHVTDNGTLYSQLTKKHKTSEGYVFKFDTGDEFTCASDTTYPTSSSISDSAPTELPAVTASDKGKYLHTNESTGALEWDEGGSGGGVLVVTDTEGTLDKTWTEIKNAMLAGGAVVAIGDDARAVANAYMGKSDYAIDLAGGGLLAKSYSTDSASGYPSR